MSHAHLAAGWLELRRGDTAAAARSAAAGLQFGQAHQDRSAVAEALLLQASLSDPPDPALAEESRRLARDLGDRIGEARAALAVARSLEPRARATQAIAAAEHLLVDAGAWGVLAEVRESRSRPEVGNVTVVDARRVPRQPPRRSPSRSASGARARRATC